MSEQQLDRQASRLSLREQLGSRFQSFRASRGRERKRSQDEAVNTPKGPEVMSPRSREALARGKQEALDALPADYYQPDYDPVAGELAMLPRMFTESDLEAVVEERSGVLETVSERLSQHVLSNYSKFVAGVTEVASVERDLQDAHMTAKTSRSELANALAEVRANMVITRKQRQKQGLERMLGMLQQLREAAHLHDALRAAQENGEFAGSFWLCAQCARALVPLSFLLVAPELTATVSALYEETVARLESSLQTVCADFQPDPYAKVLEGYVYLGNVGSLGEEVMAAFAAVVGMAALKVARGVVLTRPVAGLEERVKSTQLLQELVKFVPPDLFRTCLTRVLMVVFEILSSHYHMSRWHEERIQQHTGDMEALHSAGLSLRERIDTLVQEQATSPTAAESPVRSERAGASANGSDAFVQPEEDEEDAEGSIAAVVERSLQRAVKSKAHGLPKADSSGSPRDAAEAEPVNIQAEDAEAQPEAEQSTSNTGSSGSLAAIAGHAAEPESGQPSGGDDEQEELVDQDKGGDGAVENGGEQPDMERRTAAASPSGKAEDKGGGKGGKRKNAADAKALEIEYLEGELEALAEKEREEVLWGEALMQVEEGLKAGRRWLWDEASRKVGMLLAAPAAFQGEHFLQVLEWTQTMLEAGEAFCGSESATLRDALKRQSGRFFAAYHSANLQALHSMLEREVWKQLPMIPGGLPSIRGALAPGSGNAAFPFDTSDFGAWVAHGNPWRMQAYEDEEDEAEGQRTPGQPSEGEPSAEPASGAAEASGNGAIASAEAGPASDDARALTASTVSTSGRGVAEAVPPMTTSSLRLAKWLAEYATLIRLIRSEAGRVWSGMAELFELYFLHTFHTFGDISVLELTSPQQQRQGGGDIVPVRLKNAVLRILGRSKYRQYYLQQPAAATAGAAGGAAGPGTPPQGTPQYGGATPPHKDYSPFGRLPPAAQPSPQTTAFSHPGNMFGLMERKVAVDSLRSVAGLLSDAYSRLHEAVFGRTDVPENHTLDTFFSTVKATADLRDMVLRAAARYNLPIRWLPDRLAEQNFNIDEPPTRASPWVKVLMSHAAKLRQSLDASSGLSPANVDELWRHAMHFTAEVVLEGIAKAGAKGRCTPMGRAAMSLDLQAVQKGLADLAGPGGAEAAADSLRLVDTYIKAFYLPWGEELRRWALTHPEYTRDQIMMLVVCIAEANGLKRKERNAFLQLLEADLSDLRAVP